MGSSQGPSSLVLKAVLLCLLFFTHTSSDPHPTAKASLPCAHLVPLHSQLQHTQEVLGERYQGWGGVPLSVPTRVVFHFLFSNLLSSFIIRNLNSCFARINLFSPLSLSGIKGKSRWSYQICISITSSEAKHPNKAVCVLGHLAPDTSLEQPEADDCAGPSCKARVRHIPGWTDSVERQFLQGRPTPGCKRPLCWGGITAFLHQKELAGQLPNQPWPRLLQSLWSQQHRGSTPPSRGQTVLAKSIFGLTSLGVRGYLMQGQNLLWGADVWTIHLDTETRIILFWAVLGPFSKVQCGLLPEVRSWVAWVSINSHYSTSESSGSQDGFVELMPSEASLHSSLIFSWLSSFLQELCADLPTSSTPCLCVRAEKVRDEASGKETNPRAGWVRATASDILCIPWASNQLQQTPQAIGKCQSTFTAHL